MQVKEGVYSNNKEINEIMKIDDIDKAKILIDGFIRLREIKERLQDGDLVVATHHDCDDDEIQGFDYVDRMRLYIPAPLRAAFLDSVNKMIEIESRKITEL